MIAIVRTKEMRMPVFSVIVVTAPPPGFQPDNGWMTKIDGRETILRTVELFLNRDNIKQIQVVVDPSINEEARRKFGGHFSFSGIKIAVGGPKWIDQVAAAAEKVSEEATHVLIHDAARPAVPYSDLDALLEEAEKKPIVSLCAPVRSTLAEVDEGGNAMAVRAPNEFVQLLTPQSFEKSKLMELAKAKKEPHASEISLLTGSGLNIRLGHGEAGLVKAMINLLPKPKIKGPLSPFDEAQW
jgi:2-C-methyl-D-erythritol 4-phosphate cytidylyltransferase/2-C-methyl-D-erythritol 2,4-cyclodiphosphate synthase